MALAALLLGLASWLPGPAPALARGAPRRQNTPMPRQPPLPRLARVQDPGLRFCHQRLLAAAGRKAPGARRCIVLDIDNTLVDTRARTLAAARAFARQHPRYARLGRLTLQQVGYDGRQTAAGLGYAPRTAEAFQRFWDGYFWDAANFKHDRPIRGTVGLARQAKALGLEVFYLTGRVQSLKGGTLRQLARLGLPDADPAHLICKPQPGAGGAAFLPTAPFKVQQLERLQRRREVVLFVSDSAQDILLAQRQSPGACVKVRFPVAAPGAQPRLPARTPTIDLGRAP